MKKENFSDLVKNSSAYLKNKMRFDLLVLLPSFQEDIEKTRKELNIDIERNQEDEHYKEWYEKEIIETTDKIISSKQHQKNIEELKQIRGREKELKKDWELKDKIPLYRLGHRIDYLGQKYNLPANFYKNKNIGIGPYLTKNEMIIPMNNWIMETEPERKGEVKLISIKTFGPISTEDFKNISKELKSLQNRYFPEQISIDKNKRAQFEGDLEIFRQLNIERKAKPIKKKGYLDKSYMARLERSYPNNKKILGKYEKDHKEDIEIKFSEKTSKELSKEMKINENTIRISLKRTNQLISELFGDEFLPFQ